MAASGQASEMDVLSSTADEAGHPVANGAESPVALRWGRSQLAVAVLAFVGGAVLDHGLGWTGIGKTNPSSIQNMPPLEKMSTSMQTELFDAIASAEEMDANYTNVSLIFSALFTQFDENSDGYIEKIGYIKFRQFMPKIRIKALRWSALDVDEDHRISPRELLTGLKNAYVERSKLKAQRAELEQLAAESTSRNTSRRLLGQENERKGGEKQDESTANNKVLHDVVDFRPSHRNGTLIRTGRRLDLFQDLVGQVVSWFETAVDTVKGIIEDLWAFGECVVDSAEKNKHYFDNNDGWNGAYHLVEDMMVCYLAKKELCGTGQTLPPDLGSLSPNHIFEAFGWSKTVQVEGWEITIPDDILQTSFQDFVNGACGLASIVSTVTLGLAPDCCGYPSTSTIYMCLSKQCPCFADACLNTADECCCKPHDYHSGLHGCNFCGTGESCPNWWETTFG